MSVMVKVDPAVDSTRPLPVDLDFTQAPPGMMGLRSFTLQALDDAGYLFAMRSTDHPDVRLFLVPPQAYFPRYTPQLDDETRTSLGLDEDPVLLVVVHPGQDGLPPTANLLAPVAVNPATGSAVQVVLDGTDWPLRAPFTVAA